MKRWAVLLGLLGFMGCVPAPDGSATTVEPGQSEAVAESPQPTFLDHPVDYWVEQARAGDRSESTDRVVEALTLALNHETPEIRVAAADALGVVAADANPAIPALVGQLSHEVPWVRVAAMETLGTIGAPAVPELVKAVQTGTGAVPIRSCLVLGGMGPEAKEAIPALEAAMADESCTIRERIPAILALLRPAADAGHSGASDAVADLVIAPVEVATLPAGEAADWPGFHGPRRDSICTETGLLKEWPEGGPPLVRKIEGLGRGFSTVAIVGDTIYTMGDRTPEGEDEAQYTIALDLATGDERWATRVGPPHDAGDRGPRCTPTVDGDRVYVLGTEGDLVCLAADSGDVLWQKNLVDDFGGQMMSGWKYSESPLVDGDKVVCTPGGEEAGIVALNKMNGATIWTCAIPPLGEGGKDGAGYSSMVVAEIDGVRQYVQMLGRGVVGVEADTGRFLWGYNKIANEIANITAPIVHGNYVFATTSYRTGCVLLNVSRAGDDFVVEEVYFLTGRDFENHHGGVVWVGNHLYGGNGANKGGPVCLDLTNGEIAWKPRAPGRGSAAIVYADGMLIFRYDRGQVVLIEATPDEYRVKGSFEAIKGDNAAWAHPVVHDGKLYLRHGDILAVYDLRAATP